MTTSEILQFLQEKIHTVIVATIDKNGMPFTCAVDIMDYDNNGLYFLTAKGKNFYDRLKQTNFLSLTGIKGPNTLSCIAISLRGNVKELGANPLPKLLQQNPYMYQIYPTEASRTALTVFQIYQGNGEWFDLSTQPITRISFTFGKAEKNIESYIITSQCIGCQQCAAVCPQQCIDISRIPAVIRQQNCLHCGACFTICPAKAIQKQSL